MFRIADYFVVATIDEADLKQALEDSKRRGLNQSYHGKVVDRFPAKDHDDTEFPRDLQMFCFPQGTNLSMYRHKPSSFQFVLTEANGTRIYCCALVFYEELESKYQQILHSPSRDSVLNAEGQKKLYAPKCICLTSRWPFYMSFETFLQQLYTNVSQNTPIPPIERILTNFMFECPLPPLGRISVEWKGFGGSIFFRRPPPNKKPLTDIDVSVLFKNLSVDNILLLFSAVLCEKRILFVSEDLGILTTCSEAICSLIVPFYWRHVYIPILPQQLTDFVCAPMPFMVGVHSSYLPDELMLDRVVVVDLDGDTLSVTPSEPIADLPEKGRRRLLKGLVNAGITEQMMSRPLSTSFPLKLDVVENTFLKFFAKMFRSYRNYLEAPSDYVEDKFKKSRFIQDQLHVPEDISFLTEFMETQMFQCFVDDRYADVKQTSNLEVLYFDETIDAFMKKETPFLSDTSQEHRSSHVVMPIYVEDLETPEVRYSRFPSLSPNLITSPRSTVNLLSEKDETISLHNKTNIAHLSMKFFQEKGQYNQHFHSLKLHSAKQDRAFRDLTKFLRREQSFEENTVSDLDKLCQEVVDPIGMHGKTGTSIDGAWEALRSHKSEMSGIEGECVRMMREHILKLTDTVQENEHQLKILFNEAASLQDMTAKGKASVERQAARADKMKQKYKEEKAGLSSKILTHEDIRKLVSTQSAAENALLLKDEADTNFCTFLKTYEQRMPQIIGSIRQLNMERITTFKKTMSTYVSSKKAVLQNLLASMDNLEKAVNEVDVEKDREVFTQGTTDFWAIGVGNTGESNMKPPPMRKAASESKLLDVHREASTQVVNMTMGDIYEEPSVTGTERRRSLFDILNNANQESLSNEQGQQMRTSLSGPPSRNLSPRMNDKTNVASTTTTTAGNNNNNNNTGGGGHSNTLSIPSLAAMDSESKHSLNSAEGSLTPRYAPSPTVQHSRKASINATLTSAKDDSDIGTRLMEATFTPPVKKRALLSYPMNMWGGNGFDVISTNAHTTKLVIKEVIALLEQWTFILDKKAVMLQNCHDKKLPAPSCVGASEGTYYNALGNSVQHMTSITHTTSHLFKQLHSHMRLTKGELKQSMKRYQEHKLELESELSAAENLVAKSTDKLGRAMMQMENIEEMHRPSVDSAVNQQQMVKHSAKIARAKQDYQEAEHEHLRARRKLQATLSKRDVCVARILRLYEEKIRRSNEAMHRTIVALTAILRKYFVDYRMESAEQLMDTVKRMDVVSDMSAFAENRLPVHLRLKKASEYTFHKDLNQLENGFDLGVGYLTGSYRLMKAVNTLMDEYLSIGDKEMKLLRDKHSKIAFRLVKCPNSTLKGAFDRLNITLDNIFTIWSNEVEIKREITSESIHTLKTNAKQRIKSLKDVHENRIKGHHRIVHDYEKAFKEEKRAEAALQTIVEKLKKAKATSSSSSGEKEKKSFFGKFKGSNTTESLQKKALTAEAEYQKMSEIRAAKEKLLQESKENLKTANSEALQEMEQHEIQRIEALRDVLSKAYHAEREQVGNIRSNLEEMIKSCREIDVDRDIQKFIVSNRTNLTPPEWVEKDMEKLDEEEKQRLQGSRETELDLAGFDVLALTVNGSCVPELQLTIIDIDPRFTVSSSTPINIPMSFMRKQGSFSRNTSLPMALMKSPNNASNEKGRSKEEDSKTEKTNDDTFGENSGTTRGEDEVDMEMPPSDFGDSPSKGTISHSTSNRSMQSSTNQSKGHPETLTNPVIPDMPESLLARVPSLSMGLSMSNVSNVAVDADASEDNEEDSPMARPDYSSSDDEDDVQVETVKPVVDDNSDSD